MASSIITIPQLSTAGKIWQKVFDELAHFDGYENFDSQSENPVINIKKLQAYLRTADSKKVRRKIHCTVP